MRARTTILGIGFTALVGIAATVACSASITFGIPGAGYTAFTPYGSCGVVDGYAVAEASDCPGVSCASDYYAICNGTAWVGCDCDLSDISTYTVISDPSFAGAPGGEGGGAGSAGEGGGSGSAGEGGGSGSSGEAGGSGSASEGGGSGSASEAGGGSGSASEGGGGSGSTGSE
jgi:hypothetical protein